MIFNTCQHKIYTNKFGGNVNLFFECFFLQWTHTVSLFAPFCSSFIQFAMIFYFEWSYVCVCLSHIDGDNDNGSLSMGILCKCFSLFLAFSAPSFYRVLLFFDTATKQHKGYSFSIKINEAFPYHMYGLFFFFFFFYKNILIPSRCTHTYIWIVCVSICGALKMQLPNTENNARTSFLYSMHNIFY